MPEDLKQRLWELISDIKVAMVVTHSGRGDSIRARPMAARPRPDEGAIYFLTDVDTAKDDEIHHNANVCISFSDPRSQRFVSVSGAAEVMQDSALVARLWTVADKAFWANASDLRIRVVKVEPERGEFWEGAGLLASVVSMLKGGKLDGRRTLGENQKVSM